MLRVIAGVLLTCRRRLLVAVGLDMFLVLVGIATLEFAAAGRSHACDGHPCTAQLSGALLFHWVGFADGEGGGMPNRLLSDGLWQPWCAGACGCSTVDCEWAMWVRSGRRRNSARSTGLGLGLGLILLVHC
jgi:hypothetical protein